MRRYALSLFWCFYFLQSTKIAICRQITCKDERNRDIDWFVNYKIPKIETEPPGTNLGNGEAYAYILSSRPSSWRLSSYSITSNSSMMGNTLQNLYANKRNISYLFYNDESPAEFSGSSVGHLKGVVAFDKDTGYWLSHSIPKFADDTRFKYPDNALVNGQSILCVTFRTATLNEICNQLLYSHPNIYARALSSDVAALLQDNAKSLFTDNPAFIRRDPLTRTASLRSLGNKVFVSFAKDNQYNFDLYDSIIAPGLKSSLLTETWRRGSGSFLPPSCRSDYSVIDIISVNMTIPNRRNTHKIFFRSTEDHSKWAISVDSKQSWICVADMNRMVSQERRGGGALCFNSKPVWNAYNAIISETDQCPNTIRNK